MPNGDKPKYSSFNLENKNQKKVPGLRDYAPPSPCKVYKMVNGVKTLDHIEGIE